MFCMRMLNPSQGLKYELSVGNSRESPTGVVSGGAVVWIGGNKRDRIPRLGSPSRMLGQSWVKVRRQVHVVACLRFGNV